MTWGPVQILVVAFPEPRFTGEILPELTRLREADVVRLIDLVLVERHANGTVDTVEMSDLSTEERVEFGAMVGALIGLGLGGEEGLEEGALSGAVAGAEGSLLEDVETWDVLDEVPPGSVAAVALLEHRWAVPLQEAVGRAGGAAVVDAWVHPRDLVAIGADAARTARTPG